MIFWLLLLPWCVAKALPELAKVDVLEVSRDDVEEGRCDGVGPSATSSRFVVRSDVRGCDEAAFVDALRWDGEAWNVEWSKEVERLPSLIAAKDAKVALLVDATLAVWDDGGEFSGLIDKALSQMILLQDGRVVATGLRISAVR